ncbi:MAG TPA: hypothetical protein VE287_04540 [Actinopolymorphaceae bacterium]|nr:hypothetical protein [Actinopolymorphaceae bacterium]
MRPELSSEDRDILVKAAILAPSMHNTQPWKFRFHDHEIYVHRDPRRELGAEDPDGRLTLIGVGAAVFNLRVAAARLGWEAATTLLPDRSQPTLAAQISLEQGANGSADLAGLYPWLPRRRTNRFPFTGQPIPTSVREELAQAAHAEHVILEWVEQDYRTRWLLELASDADFADPDEPQRLAERQLWVGGERTSDGIGSESLGPRAREPSAGVRDLAVDPADRMRKAQRFEHLPVLAVLLTRHDSPADWLMAGQALQRVLLVATGHGLAASLLNQPIEHKDLRWLVRDPRTGWAQAQSILRLGYGPEVPPTPRRSPEEFLLPGDSSDGPGVPDQSV